MATPGETPGAQNSPPPSTANVADYHRNVAAVRKGEARQLTTALDKTDSIRELRLQCIAKSTQFKSSTTTLRELMTNEIALPKDLSRRSPKLTLFEGAAVNVVYTNFQELRNCSRRDAALYMAERALFSSTPKTIRKLNMVIGKRHPANEVTLSAVELRDIPGFAMRTTCPVSSVTSMDWPDLHITLKIGAPVRLTKDPV
ncbi:hypothetical protein PtB15_11B640 [Puccinia triticina]|nr:hypothetical protein PtB15_11B640 [Puccinia triticina]